jgi:NADP-dependent 3-hydroxy acid dehydrogenase YdfG
MDEVEGKVAFITGAASGIGLEMAAAFARAGMKVAVTDSREDHLARARERLADTSGTFRFMQLDVTDRAGWVHSAAEAERALGRIDVLCRNAGIGVLGTVAEATWDDWDWLMGVNLGGVINGLTADMAMRRMFARHPAEAAMCRPGE